MLSVMYTECHKLAIYAECHNAECHYAECDYDECRVAFKFYGQPYLEVFSRNSATKPPRTYYISVSKMELTVVNLEAIT
jgi:hypothetical protein